MNIADRSVCVTGNLQNGPISYTCYPVNEFNNGKYLIAVNSVVFDSTENISLTSMITCNFVTNTERSARGEIEIYQEPLNIFHLKTCATLTRGIFRFCKYVCCRIEKFCIELI